MLIQSNLLQILSDGISGGGFWAYNGRPKPARRRFPIIIPMRFEDFDILINKGFLNDTRELTSILPTVQFEVICNRFTSEEEDQRGCEKRQRKSLNPVIEKISTNLNNV